MSWKIPAAAKVSVCRHSLACSQACLRAQLLWAIPPQAGFVQGPHRSRAEISSKVLRRGSCCSVGLWVVQLAHFTEE